MGTSPLARAGLRQTRLDQEPRDEWHLWCFLRVRPPESEACPRTSLHFIMTSMSNAGRAPQMWGKPYSGTSMQEW
eukprot:6682642-Pyramimonas_sp.AAC.1